MINIKKKFLIYGYGVSGKSIAIYLNKKNAKFSIYDDFLNLSKLKNSIDINFLLKNIKNFDYFVVSPSIKIDKDHFLFPHRSQILIDLDFLQLELKDQITIGVTGTEGKSTTCEYISQILNKKYKNIIIGNYGRTILDKKFSEKNLRKLDVIIIELSSYQLDKIKFLKLDHALITNIHSDHINYHGSFIKYIKSKFKIQFLLKKNGCLHINKDNLNLYKDLIRINIENIHTVKIKRIKQGNLIDMISSLNTPIVNSLIKKIDSSLNLNNFQFKNLPFRSQLIKNNSNLKIFNDSKCTNLENAVMKINYISGNYKILILGGIPKTVNKRLIIKDSLILIFGPYAYQISQNLSFRNSKFLIFHNLFDLLKFVKINISYKHYKTILFSPGGESFDQFKDFKDRGKFFNSLIKKLKF